MQVEYERYSFSGDPRTELDSVSWWIESNLKDGGIESKVAKLASLLSIVAEKWLIDNPNRVEDVAYAIQCEGRLHRLRDTES